MPTILFDIDGTLLDTAPGVMEAARFAIGEMGFAALPDEVLRRFVGPPPVESYQKFCGATEEQAHRAAVFHRQYGREKGLYASRPYPGMARLLEELEESGARLGVATLKAQDVAERILEYHGFKARFGAIVGVDATETRTKRRTIELALEQLGSRASEAVLIGDIEYDREGASQAGVAFLGVDWGYGFAPRAPGTVSTVAELSAALTKWMEEFR